METIKAKEMYLIVQDTPFNRKHHNYKIGDICDCSKKHNAKYFSYKKAKAKLIKTPREKQLVFMENLHEKVRKSINPKLPSRLSSIILYDNLADCYNLSSKWLNKAKINTLGIYKVLCDGILHGCSTTPDDKKPTELSKKAHIDGITKFWQGIEPTETKEYFFQGKAEIIDIIN